MIPEEFQILSKDEKLRWVYFEGEHIMAIRYYEYKVILYVINHFLVEVFYHHTQGIIEKVEVMERSNKRLKFYADQVRLSNL